MPTTRTVLAVVAITAVVAATGAGCRSGLDKAGGSSGEHPHVLRVANTKGLAEVQPYADQVARLSSGHLTLSIQSKWERDSNADDDDAIRAVRAGEFDLAVVAARAWDDVGVTDFDALLAPMEINSLAAQQEVLSSGLSAQMLNGVKRLGLQGIGILPGPMRLPAGISHPLLVPKDYAGTRIGMNRSVVANRSLRALGAVPVETPFEGSPIDEYDGIEQQVVSIADNQYDGTVRWVTMNAPLWPRPLVVVANAKAFSQLSGAQQGWLQQAARAALGPTTNVQMSWADLAPMCRRGRVTLINASPTQLKQMRTAFDPVYTWLRSDPKTAMYLDRIGQLTAQTKAYPQETPSCAGLSSKTTPVAAVSPIDGIYTLTVTPKELLAAGSPDVRPENYGSYTWIFDRGRWDETQVSDKASTWVHGHFVVKGSTLTLYVDDGGGVAPTGAGPKPGDSGSLRWSLYHGELTIRPIPANLDPSDYPVSYTVHPWRRIGDAPSSATDLDGSYQLTLSAAELQAAGVPRAEIIPENMGDTRLVLRHGQFAMTQQSGASCTWAYGTFTIAGNRIELTFVDGGGASPDNATNKRGEVFDYTWSTYHKAMRLSVVADAVSPRGWTVAPWTQVSQTPSATELNRNCPPPPAALS